MSLQWGLPRPKFGRHIPPRAAGPKPPGDRFEHLTVITPRTTLTTDATAQRRLYQLPQLIGNHTSPDHPAMIDLPTIILWETRSSTATTDCYDCAGVSAMGSLGEGVTDHVCGTWWRSGRQGLRCSPVGWRAGSRGWSRDGRWPCICEDCSARRSARTDGRWPRPPVMAGRRACSGCWIFTPGTLT